MVNKELTPNEENQLEELVERNGLPEQGFSVVEEESEAEEISRGSFFLEIDRQLDKLQEQYIQIQLRIMTLRDTKAKIKKAENRGMRVHFFETEESVFFKAEEKEAAGFVKNLPSRPNDWLKVYNERQRKINEGDR